MTNKQITFDWQDLAEQINLELDHLTQFDENCPAKLSNAARYSLLAGGKRLRPILVLLACELCGGSTHQALKAACAVEMIHTYSLIHDDLPAMDDDDLRRGKPTCHRQYDEPTAILAGDGLLTYAFEVLASNISDAHISVACIRELAEAAGFEGMAGGQQADLEAEQIEDPSIDQLMHIHQRKTGRLITCSVRIGALIAGATSERMDYLTTYGEALGLAFQITDDILDRTGNALTMGKSVQKDDDRDKLTYPTLLGLEESQRKAEELCETACQAMESFGQQGCHLTSLARYAVNRDR